MKIVIFGLTVSSAWGNGHATLWRGLCRALHDNGHDIVFFERDVPYYAAHRDLHGAPWCRLVLYESWSGVAAAVQRELTGADVAIVTSYCPDARAAARTVCSNATVRKVFYDLDSPITLDHLARGEPVDYLPEHGLGAFDLVLSYAGGAALDDLRRHTGARTVAPLYGSVDPAVHHPVRPSRAHEHDLSYLGTFASDRQPALQRLFLDAASARPHRKFAIAGSQYPPDFPWTSNVHYLWHLPPSDHPPFFCASALTLNVTRKAMTVTGFCPSGRLFEAAACGTPIVSDEWPGLDCFFAPGREILVASDTADVLDALDLSDEERDRVGRLARERTLACHTAAARARELEQLLEPGTFAAGAA
jgi:spore maturation protein CgeB